MLDMADKKKSKKRKEEFLGPEETSDKPSDDEYKVAKWLKKNVQIKKTKFLNHNVQYFTGSKAVDALMASSWGTATDSGKEPFFHSRDHCVTYLDVMLRHKFFHRARKVPVPEDLLKPKKKKGAKTEEKEDKPVEEKDNEKKEKKDKEVGEGSQADVKGPEASENEEERKKKKKKIRLEMHMQQAFVDNLDAYVWIYDPIPVYYWLIGFMVVLGGIIVCLFPLWPSSVRKIVYYLSVAAAVFLVFIILLVVVRSIVFCMVWLITLGKHHLWLLPNLTEDVGVLASFWPLYHYEYKGDEVSVKKKKKAKKDKLSDNEEEPENTTNQPPPPPPLEEEPKDEVKDLEPDGGSGSESEGSSQQSQTGKDFEMVEKSEIEQH